MEEAPDWGFLPPTALHVVCSVLPLPSQLKCRLVCKHWQECLAPLVLAINIVPEYFTTAESTPRITAAFPKATTYTVDLQDTFISVPAPIPPPDDPAPEEPASDNGSGDINPTDGALSGPADEHAAFAALADAGVPGDANAGNAAVADGDMGGAAAPADDPAGFAALADGIMPPVPSGSTDIMSSAITLDPVSGLVSSKCTSLRIRLPDSHQVTVHKADIPSTWTYVSNLVSQVGPQLQSLHLSTAPIAATISMLLPLTQLTSLTMEEASHSQWSADHISIVGQLTNLRSLSIKVPPFRPKPEAPSSFLAPSAGHLASWTALTQLTKLQVCVLRHSYHSSLVSILPHLTLLEHLTVKASQTRLPWPGTDRPLFSIIPLLSRLTFLSLALVDHIMLPENWKALQTLSRLISLDINASSATEGLGIPDGLDLPNLRFMKLRYPNSQDLVRLAGLSALTRLDIKFPEHELEYSMDHAVQELQAIVSKLTPNRGTIYILDLIKRHPDDKDTQWWSPLMPLLALTQLTDFRCSAKEGPASHLPILFDEILTGMSVSWLGMTRLCFKGHIAVVSQSKGWDGFKCMTQLQQLELRHHPPPQPQPAQANVVAKFIRVEPIRLPAVSLPSSLLTLLLENVELRRKENDCLKSLTSLERRTNCRHFPEFMGMPLQRLVVSNCCVKAKGISSIAAECSALTHLVFAVYKAGEPEDLGELQMALCGMVSQLSCLHVLKVRVQATCITDTVISSMISNLPNLVRLKITSSDGWEDTEQFERLTHMTGLRKVSLSFFRPKSKAQELRSVFRERLPYCKIKAKSEDTTQH